MSIVHVQGLTHAYGDKSVFRDVSFRLLNYEHVGIVGPNGAGKSTLFKILTGEILPDGGEITWLPTVKAGSLEQHIDLDTGESIRDYLQQAFATLFDAEKEMVQLTEQMADAEGSQLASQLNRFSQLQSLLEQHDFYSIDPEIERVAAGLGLTELGLGTDVCKLSGGQRTKLLLAKLLLEKPDVLLLDEPTNYLDTAHIEWLKQYLKDYPHAFMIISHDMAFQNEVVNVIYHIDHKTLTRYPGNYKQFEAAYELRKQQIHQQYQRQQQQIEKLETYIQKNKARASTAKQAKSREKKLQKIDRIEKPASAPPAKFSFSVAHQPVRVLLEATELQVGYDTPLFSDVNLELKRGEKVALVGYNGIGKTTTLKTLLGELPALDGSVTFGDRVKPAYFEQDVNTTSRHTAFEEIWGRYPDLEQKEVRKNLARCGLKREHIFQPLKSLSGGEQTKVRLCELMLADSNFLILDEPTNHLDVKTKKALKNALHAYDGTVIVVSHEPSFYEDWVTQVWDVADWR